MGGVVGAVGPLNSFQIFRQGQAGKVFFLLLLPLLWRPPLGEVGKTCLMNAHFWETKESPPPFVLLFLSFSFLQP